jgi:hypothetical protein
MNWHDRPEPAVYAPGERAAELDSFQAPDFTGLSIAALESEALGGDARASAVGELVRRLLTLRNLAREANRGGLTGADGLAALTAWRLSQPIEPGEECPTCKGAGCAACRGTGRR